MRIAVLGGTGTLGKAVVAAARAAGHEVRAVSRHGETVADVTTGAGLAEAFAEVDAIVDGTNAMATAREVLVDGTRRVLEVAAAAGVRHFVGISIVGIDDAPLAYYQHKVVQEQVIEAGAVPWSILRATQFHDLVPRFATPRLGIVFAPRGAKLQPVEVRDVATHVLAVVAAGPSRRVPDVGGPEVRDLPELVRAYKRAAKLRRLVLAVPLPGKLGRFLRAGKLCNPARAVGTGTFETWLHEHYPG